MRAAGGAGHFWLDWHNIPEQNNRYSLFSSILYINALYRILLGFIACSLLLFAVAHPQFSYLALLAVSAFFRQQSIQKVRTLAAAVQATPDLCCYQWDRRSRQLGQLAHLLPRNGLRAQTAADTALSPYLGGDIVGLLFTIVFLLLFFLIVGGLMTWGYKAFRNEDAAVPMTAFIGRNRYLCWRRSFL